tara:strand:+ start:11020 stop:11247 length:228 start_codon:yes stop_codon:yes gene_type:complete
MRIFRKNNKKNTGVLTTIANDLNEKSSTISALSKGLGVSSDITKKSILISLKTVPRFIDSALLITLTALLTRFFM